MSERRSFRNLDEVEAFLAGPQTCPEHGEICNRHLVLDGEVVQVLNDPSGRVSPEDYTLRRLWGKVKFLKSANERLERAADDFMRERDMSESVLKVITGEVEVARP